MLMLPSIKTLELDISLVLGEDKPLTSQEDSIAALTIEESLSKVSLNLSAEFHLSANTYKTV